jgi:hypothetical protein
MTTRPTHTPGWATGGANPVTSPTGSERSAGWAARQRVPASLLNGILQESDEWVEYLDTNALKRFASLEAMWVDGSVSTNETVSIAETTNALGSTTLNSPGADVTAVDCDGRRVYLSTATIRRAVRPISGTSEWNVSGSGQGAVRMACDGGTLVRHVGTFLRAEEPSGTGERWVKASFTGPVNQIAVLGNRVLVACQSFTDSDGTFSTRLLNAATGALVWGVSENQTFASALGGGDAYAAVTTDGSDLRLRRYVDSGTGTVQSITITASTAAPIIWMCTDGELLMAVRNTASGGVVCYNARDLNTTVWSEGLACDLVCMDDQYVYLHPTGAFTVVVREKYTGRVIRTLTLAGTDAITCMCCDGQYVYVGRSGTADRVERLVVARRRPRIWQLADTNDTFRPFPWAVTPGGAA